MTVDWLGILHDYLSSFVSSTLPKAKPGKKSKFVLGVSEPNIGHAIQVRASLVVLAWSWGLIYAVLHPRNSLVSAASATRSLASSCVV